MGLEPSAGRVLSFADIYRHIQALRELMAAFKAFNSRKRQCPESGNELEAVNSSADAVETAAAPLLSLSLDPRCCSCRAKRLRRAPGADCSDLAHFYLRYKIVEALQPHPNYKSDDGFQPFGLVSTLRFCDEPGADQALDEFNGRQPPIMAALADLIEKGIVVQTPFEPWNGDVMLGLRANLPLREAAHQERRRLIETLAEKFSHRLGWNEDGTGWLAPTRRNCGGVRGSIWDLLSYLRALEHTGPKGPRTIN